MGLESEDGMASVTDCLIAREISLNHKGVPIRWQNDQKGTMTSQALLEDILT